MIKNLTKGPVSKTLIAFTLPMFISVVFQQMYNMADSVIAGRFAGKLALAAVGASYPVTMLFMAIAIGLSVGVSVIISQLFGKGELGKMKTAVNTSIISAIILSIVLTILGTFLCTPILSALNTHQDIFADSKVYLDIYVWGLCFLFLYNVSSGLFNALGDSKTPLFLLIASSIGNIVLDLIFVINFNMGVSGVAWATFIAQGASGIIATILILLRIKKMNITQSSCAFSFNMLKRISYIAVPSIIQQSFVSVGMVFIQGLINSFGTDVTAGYSAAIKLNTFAVTCFNTMGNAVSNFTAQNIGAGKLERVRKGSKSGVIMVLCVCLPFVILYFFFGNIMMGLFLNPSETQAMDVGILFLKIISPFYFFVAAKLILDCVLRGASAIKMFMASTFSDLLLRVIIAFILANYLGSVGVWISWPIGWILSTILAVCFYKSNRWAKGYS